MFPLKVHDEPARLAELRSFEVLDSGVSASLDALVDFARRLLDMPICLVSLIDEHRQWFKARAGLDIAETPRELAFCDHTIRSDDILVVEDATQDDRFRLNPLVTGGLGIRFYAGAPLVVRPGLALGSVCVIDTKPRSFSAADVAILEHVRTVAMALLDGHRTTRISLRNAELAEMQRARLAESRRDLRLKERRFEQTEAIARVGGWELDVATKRLCWSDEVYNICGVPLGTPLTLELALSVYPEESRTRLSAMLDRALGEGIGYDDEFEIVSRCGTVKQVHTAVDVEQVGGVPTRLFGIIQDVSERHLVLTKLWNTAHRDVLTGLFNRAHFSDVLSGLFHAERDPAGEVGLLMIDVDHLKEVNDTLGHEVGDMLLRTVAHRLEAAVGAAGRVARIGGDEFAVAIERDATATTLARLGRAILLAMQGKFTALGETIAPQVSIGGALARLEDTAETLRQKADLALYEAKKHRRGGYMAFREDMRLAILKRLAVVRGATEALDEGRVLPHYQPIVSLETSHIMGLEALARIRDRDGRILSAGAFQEAFQEHKVASRFTLQMLDRVAQDMRSWLDQGLTIDHVGINVTGADFQRGDLHRRIDGAFARHGVPLKHILLEVTETVYMNGSDRAVGRAVERLRGEGLLVALDDFGTGFASLTHLKDFPVDVLKIDKSFVADMLTDRSSGPIIEALMDLSDKLGIKIVAEGIETEAQSARLAALGCRLGQGYLFARPADAETTTTLLKGFAAHRPLSGLWPQPAALRG